MRGVRSVVRRALLRAEETKILPVLGASLNMGGTQTYVFNPQYQVSQGVGSGSRVGRKIQRGYLLLNFRYSHRGENAVTANVSDKSFLRLLVLRSRAVKTAGVASNNLQVNPSFATAADIFYQSGAGTQTFSQVDKNKWTVLMDRVYTSIRNIDSAANITNAIQRRNIRVPFPKTVTYRDDPNANSFSTEAETYVVFTAGWDASDTLDFVGTLETQGTIRWKDA